MNEKPLAGVKFPGLPDIYGIPQIDRELNKEGHAADAAATGAAIGTLAGQLETVRDDLATSYYTSATVDTKISEAISGGSGSGGGGGMQEEFSHYLSTGEITKSGNIYTHVTPGKASVLYTITLHATKLDEEDSEEGAFYSFVLGYRQIQHACTAIGWFDMYVSCYNIVSGAFEHMKLKARRDSATGKITFTFDGQPKGSERVAWDLYHIRGLY